MNIRRWETIVASWSAGDAQGINVAGTPDVLPDLGSPWGADEYVTNVGFAA